MNSIDIAEVARRTGLTTRALRFYEARGLIAPLRTGSGRRVYGPADLARLTTVVALKRAGFSLAQIRGLLTGREANLAALVSAHLAELDVRAAELADTRRLLTDIRSRIDRHEPIDVATLCSLIEKGNTMDQQKWRAIAERYMGEEARADFVLAEAKLPGGFDQADYARRWTELSSRIEGALPLDPAGKEAQGFLAEWQALLAPFSAVATPAMTGSVTRMYNDMDAWSDEQTPPFAPAVWAFIKSAQAAR